MDKVEFRERTKHLVARMLRSLSVDEVASILADSELAFRIKASPLFPKEIADMDKDILGRPIVSSGRESKIVEGFKKLIDELVDMWLE